MKPLGYLKGIKKKQRKNQSVSNMIKQQLSRIPSNLYGSFRGRRQHVEVVTPPSLFPKKSFLKTIYRVVWCVENISDFLKICHVCSFADFHIFKTNHEQI